MEHICFIVVVLRASSYINGCVRMGSDRIIHSGRLNEEWAEVNGSDRDI